MGGFVGDPRPSAGHGWHTKPNVGKEAYISPQDAQKAEVETFCIQCGELCGYTFCGETGFRIDCGHGCSAGFIGLKTDKGERLLPVWQKQTAAAQES